MNSVAQSGDHERRGAAAGARLVERRWRGRSERRERHSGKSAALVHELGVVACVTIVSSETGSQPRCHEVGRRRRSGGLTYPG